MISTKLAISLAALALAVLPAAMAQEPDPLDAPARYQRCLTLAGETPDRALGEAEAWELEGGGNLARHCAATALVALDRREEGAARLVDLAKELAEIDPVLAARLAVQAGRAWRDAERPFDAREAFDLAAGLDPQNREAFIERGWTSAYQEDYLSAVEDFSAALALAPGDPAVLRHRAAARRFLGDYDEALADIEAAIAADPDDAEAYLERGNIRRLAGDRVGAEADWRRAAAMAPGTVTAQAAETNLQRSGN